MCGGVSLVMQTVYNRHEAGFRIDIQIIQGIHLGPILLARINFNPMMVKQAQAYLHVGWNYLSIPKFHGTDK